MTQQIGWVGGQPPRALVSALARAQLVLQAVPSLEHLVASAGVAALVLDLDDEAQLPAQRQLSRRGQSRPVVHLLDRGEVELAVELIKAGAADVLVKPVDEGELVRRILAARPANQAAPEGVLAGLTTREQEVVRLAVCGMTSKEIAEHCSISFRTVEVHRRNALRKLGVRNVVGLTRLLIDPAGCAPVARSFSEREREVLALAEQGLSNKEIASRLRISTRTVEAHRANAARAAAGGPASPSSQLSLWPPAAPALRPVERGGGGHENRRSTGVGRGRRGDDPPRRAAGPARARLSRG